MPHSLMDLDEAASYLHVSRANVRSMAVHGEIPCVEKGGEIFFYRGVLKAWASKRILGLRGKHLRDYHSRGILHHHDLSPRGAIIREITDPDFMEPHLPGRSKAAVVRAMTTLAERTGFLYDPEDLVQELHQRESLCSTGIEGGAALLHPRYHDPYMVEDSFLCVGRTGGAVPFGAPDGSLTDVFFLACCQDDRTHLHVLSRLCLVCHGTTLLADVRCAGTKDEMYEALIGAEASILEG